MKIGSIDFQGLVGKAENSSIAFRAFHKTGISTACWFRQLDLAPFDGLNWPHLKACDLLFRVGVVKRR